jgi:hypothetical protein
MKRLLPKKCICASPRSLKRNYLDLEIGIKVSPLESHKTSGLWYANGIIVFVSYLTHRNQTSSTLIKHYKIQFLQQRKYDMVPLKMSPEQCCLRKQSLCTLKNYMNPVSTFCGQNAVTDCYCYLAYIIGYEMKDRRPFKHWHECFNHVLDSDVWLCCKVFGLLYYVISFAPLKICLI